MLPNFLVIGTMKGGTSSLYNYLRQHPQIFMSSVKEPLFFSTKWDQGLEWYEGLFEGAGRARAIGEASTEYSAYPLHPGVPERIAKVVPEARLVYLVRHPIERMLSEYHDYLVRGVHHELTPENPHLRDGYCYVSSYAMQIEQYLGHFSRDQLLIVKSEDLRSDRMDTLRRVYEFLGVDGSFQPKNVAEEFHKTSARRRRRSMDQALRRIPGYRSVASVAPRPLARMKDRVTTKKAPPKPTLSENARREIEDRLREDVRRLRRYMDDDFDGWGIA